MASLLASLPLFGPPALPTTGPGQGSEAGPQSRPVTLVILGHADHGKTTLASAITAVQARKGMAAFVPFDSIDVGRKWRERGITAAAAHVDFRTGTRGYTLIDAPGHMDLVKGLLTGAIVPDAAVLVVSVPDGPMPQTREQARLARRLNVPCLVVFLNKMDLVKDPGRPGSVEAQVRELLDATGWAGDELPVIRGSALRAVEEGEAGTEGTGPIDELLEVLDACPDPQSAVDRPFLMPVEDVFTVTGRGTVVTGRISRGRIAVGEEVEIVGMGAQKKTVVTGVELFRRVQDEAEAGNNVGLLLRGVERVEVERGMVLAEPASITAHTEFEAEAYLLSREEGGRHAPLTRGYRPQFFFRTADVTGGLELADGSETVIPGDRATISVTLATPIAMEEGLRFAIREGGRTLGVGVVTRVVR